MEKKATMTESFHIVRLVAKASRTMIRDHYLVEDERTFNDQKGKKRG